MEFNLDDLRRRLAILRRKNQISLRKLANDIGISFNALHRFMNYEADTAYKVACAIEDYILAEEKK